MPIAFSKINDLYLSISLNLTSQEIFFSRQNTLGGTNNQGIPLS
jgi:hypothetical protein